MPPPGKYSMLFFLGSLLQGCQLTPTSGTPDLQTFPVNDSIVTLRTDDVGTSMLALHTGGFVYSLGTGERLTVREIETGTIGEWKVATGKATVITKVSGHLLDVTCEGEGGGGGLGTGVGPWVSDVLTLEE